MRKIKISNVFVRDVLILIILVLACNLANATGIIWLVVILLLCTIAWFIFIADAVRGMWKK